MRFYIKHPNILDNPKTYLAQDYVKNQSSIKVKNTQGFSTSSYIVIGNLGFENAEVTLPQTITEPDTLGISPNTLFSHNGDTLITLIEWNKIKIYRSTAGISGTYLLLATVDIDVDADVTYYDDTTGRPTYYYKFSYFNESTNTESDVSDAFAGSGFVFYSKKTLIDRVSSLFGDSKNQFATEDEVGDWLNEFYGIAQTELALASKRSGVSKQDIQLDPDYDEYDLNTDFLVEAAVFLSMDGGKNFKTPVPMQQIDSSGRVIQSNTKYTYTIINNKIILDRKPDSTNEILRVFYNATTATLNNQTDTLSSAFVNHTGMFIKYGLAHYYLKDKNKDMYDLLSKNALDGLKLFISYLKRLSNNHLQYVEISNPEPFYQ